MATSKKARRVKARNEAEKRQKERKMARLGVTSLPPKHKHVSKKGKG